MTRYLEVAGQAKQLVQDLVAMVSEDARPAAAELVARIVNLAVRACPRGVQHTVRFNIVSTMVRGMPVRVGMVEKKDEKTGRIYNALTTKQLVADHNNSKGTIEGSAEDAS